MLSGQASYIAERNNFYLQLLTCHTPTIKQNFDVTAAISTEWQSG